MKKISLVLLAFLFIGLSCTTEKERFPISKRYWTPTDYTTIVRELKYGFKSDEKLPSFNDPKTRIIVEKLTDQQNFKVVLTDAELGLSYKNDFATEFFDKWKEMADIYDAVDRKDKYIYEREMLKVWHFGLQLQLYYFKLGNDQIIADSDDSESQQIRRLVSSNANTIISNFTNYLDQANRERYFSNSGLQLYAEGIDLYFKELVDTFPKGNYNPILDKVESLVKKIKSDVLKTSLENLKKYIEENRKK